MAAVPNGSAPTMASILPDCSAASASAKPSSMKRTLPGSPPSAFHRALAEQLQPQSRTNSKKISSILATPASSTNISAGYDRLT
jgi:hypothetical protein